MTPVQMATECVRSLTGPGTIGVVLTIPKGKMPKGFPRGELLNEMERGGVIERTYHFDSMRVLVWLTKRGLVVIRKEGERSMVIEAPNV